MVGVCGLCPSDRTDRGAARLTFVMYFVEFIRIEDDRAEPVVVYRAPGAPQTPTDALQTATVLTASMQMRHGATGYRLVRPDGTVHATRAFGTG